MSVKTVDFMPRRRDISRARFRNHYEQHHAPLAVPLFPFARYRRNHLVDQSIEPGFDCLSEFWISSLEEIGWRMHFEPRIPDGPWWRWRHVPDPDPLWAPYLPRAS